ncbi:MAG: 30S ribosomal protein S5 [Mycoplasma sp.]
MNENNEAIQQEETVKAPQAEVKTTEATTNTIQDNKFDKKDNRNGGKPMVRKSLSPVGFEEKVVQIKRISKTTKGGRSMRFSAIVVIGDKKGRVGFGKGKSIEVPDAIKKAIKNANNNIHQVKMTKRGTVYHENIGRLGASKILIKPAPQGTGIIAGGSVRAVVELAGYSDIYTKALGSTTPLNAIRATVRALEEQYTPKQISSLRDKKIG